MCSIFGGFGRNLDPGIIEGIRRRATDRGRDGGRVETYQLAGGQAVLGNWRAAPTTEVERGPLQPYNRMVHNGTVSNDLELGGSLGEIDSVALSNILDRASVETMADSLANVKGSFALAAASDRTVFLAANYKPVYYWSPDDSRTWPRTVYFSSMARHFEGALPPGQAPVALPPYSVLDLATFERADLPRLFAKRAAVICSGGLDSTTVAAQLLAWDWDVVLLHFLYGCRAEPRELARIPQIAWALGDRYGREVLWRFLKLDYAQLLPESGGRGIMSADDPLSGGIEGAEYAHEWVPARNLVMLSLASAFCEANGYHALALGNNLEEAGAYPDNEEEFTQRFNALTPFAVQNGYRLNVLSPVGHLMKHEIVKLGVSLGAPFHLTWSCYRNEETHCGRCGPCFMRAEAFRRNGLQDPVFSSPASD